MPLDKVAMDVIMFEMKWEKTMMPRDSYSDRIAARAYSDNLAMARACDRTSLKDVSDAIGWLETQAATHSDAGVLLDELRPIRDRMLVSQMAEVTETEAALERLRHVGRWANETPADSDADPDDVAVQYMVGRIRELEDRVDDLADRVDDLAGAHTDQQCRTAITQELIVAARDVVVSNPLSGGDVAVAARKFLVDAWEKYAKL